MPLSERYAQADRAPGGEWRPWSRLWRSRRLSGSGVRDLVVGSGGTWSLSRPATRRRPTGGAAAGRRNSLREGGLARGRCRSSAGAVWPGRLRARGAGGQRKDGAGRPPFAPAGGAGNGSRAPAGSAGARGARRPTAHSIDEDRSTRAVECFHSLAREVRAGATASATESRPSSGTSRNGAAACYGAGRHRTRRRASSRSADRASRRSSVLREGRSHWLSKDRHSSSVRRNRRASRAPRRSESPARSAGCRARRTAPPARSRPRKSART